MVPPTLREIYACTDEGAGVVQCALLVCKAGSVGVGPPPATHPTVAAAIKDRARRLRAPVGERAARQRAHLSTLRA